jgi:hypothetical protein
MLSVVRKGAAAFSRVAKSPCQSTQNCLASQSWRFVAHEVRVISFKGGTPNAQHPEVSSVTVHNSGGLTYNPVFRDLFNYMRCMT